MRFVEVIGLAARTLFDADFPVGLYFSRTHCGITYTNCSRESNRCLVNFFVSVKHQSNICNDFEGQTLLIKGWAEMGPARVV